MLNKLTKNLYLLCVYLFFYIPLAVVVVFSFNSAGRTMIWHGFSFKWYGELFHDGGLLTVTMHSLTIAFLAATIAVGVRPGKITWEYWAGRTSKPNAISSRVEIYEAFAYFLMTPA